MKRALYAYKITGIKTSIPFLAKIMECEDFTRGNYNTHIIENNLEFLMKRPPCGRRCQDMAAIAAYIHYKNKLDKVNHGSNGNNETNAWKNFGRKNAVAHL
jgi:acetyl-CoA carboxylase biotin carboxylase subunit